MENELNQASPELAPKPKRRSRRTKKAEQVVPEVIETAEVHYAALEKVEETPVPEVKAEPEPQPEPVAEVEKVEEPVAPRKRRTQLVRPMKQKPKAPGRPGRGQRKAR